MKFSLRTRFYAVSVGALLGLGLLSLQAAGGSPGATIPGTESLMALETYQDEAIESTWGKLLHRVRQNPFNLAATVIFFLAVIHTFMAGFFRKLSHRYEQEHARLITEEGRTADAKPYRNAKDDVSFKAQICHFLGEVEAIFGIWVVPLLIAILSFHGVDAATTYIDFNVNYVEPMFVVVIMTIASTRPVMKFAESCLRQIARFGQGTPSAWWLSILVIAPILGSFITEPAAMTIAALLLAKKFYRYDPSPRFKYGTLGLLFVNISVGGTLTHFAAPPVLMVAGTWEWDIQFMFTSFGWKAVVGILIATGAYFAFFRNEFVAINEHARRLLEAEGYRHEEPVPFWVTAVHLIAIAWTVLTLHHPPFFIGGFLFFLAFTQATAHHQAPVNIKSPLLVGFFLAGLVTHGGLQQWWIAPVLGSLSEFPLFLGATVLTAFNDNAAITYLASLVPEFDWHLYPRGSTEHLRARALEYAVVAGAVTGGGLTVIANAPNPAGQSILSKFFGHQGVSPLYLLFGALVPTLTMALCFMILP